MSAAELGTPNTLLTFVFLPAAIVTGCGSERRPKKLFRGR
jgi:hypothetical protein